ncbi:CLUMA_CG007512, isoform A [Clunio marinus]|uniref:CLUMA_CG007512, isoform A n=1 Tax=Clunio marinus TaxID=568069 RepID=A0A1J1I2J3_9DIPT|nr:CLUMA_CG007512, isoform A [Clunio marinus]
MFSLNVLGLKVSHPHVVVMEVCSPQKVISAFTIEMDYLGILSQHFATLFVENPFFLFRYCKVLQFSKHEIQFDLKSTNEGIDLCPSTKSF